MSQIWNWILLATPWPRRRVVSVIAVVYRLVCCDASCVASPRCILFPRVWHRRDVCADYNWWRHCSTFACGSDVCHVFGLEGNACDISYLMIVIPHNINSICITLVSKSLLFFWGGERVDVFYWLNTWQTEKNTTNDPAPQVPSPAKIDKGNCLWWESCLTNEVHGLSGFCSKIK